MFDLLNKWIVEFVLQIFLKNGDAAMFWETITLTFNHLICEEDPVGQISKKPLVVSSSSQNA